MRGGVRIVWWGWLYEILDDENCIDVDYITFSDGMRTGEDECGSKNADNVIFSAAV